MSDRSPEPSDNRQDAGQTPEQRPEGATQGGLGDRARERGLGDVDQGPFGTDHEQHRVDGAPEVPLSEVQARWGEALAIGGSDANHALADLARRDDIDPELRHHIANSIVGDDGLRTNVLTELADQADDPDLARRIVSDVPAADERDAALATLTNRVPTEQGHRIAHDIADAELRTDVLHVLADGAEDPQLARRIANDIPIDFQRYMALAGLARRDDVSPELGHRIANDIGHDGERTDVLSELVDRAEDPHLARRIANDFPKVDDSNSALARLARRDDVSPELGHRIAKDIRDDADLMSDVLDRLLDRTQDPDLAGRIASDLPNEAARRVAFARLADRFPDNFRDID